MFGEFAIRFLVEAIALGIAFAITSWIFGHKLRQPFLFFLFAFALSDSASRVLFGHYPDLRTGWLSYAIVAGIALVACLPVLLVMLFFVKRKQKHDRAA